MGINRAHPPVLPTIIADNRGVFLGAGANELQAVQAELYQLKGDLSHRERASQRWNYQVVNRRCGVSGGRDGKPKIQLIYCLLILSLYVCCVRAVADNNHLL